MSPLDRICPLLAVNSDAFDHGGRSLPFSAVALHHNKISNTLSTARSSGYTGAHTMATRSASLVPGLLCRDAAQTAGVGTVAGHQQRQSRPAANRPAALSRQSGPSAARTTAKRPRDRELSPQCPPLYSCGHRGRCANTGCTIRYARTVVTQMSACVNEHKRCQCQIATRRSNLGMQRPRYSTACQQKIWLRRKPGNPYYALLARRPRPPMVRAAA